MLHKFVLKVSKYLTFANVQIRRLPYSSRNLALAQPKTHNHILEANVQNHATCQDSFVILQPMFYKPMIEAQMPLYKTDGVVSVLGF